LKDINHYSKVSGLAEHPSKILIPKHFPFLKKPQNTSSLSINFRVFNDDNSNNNLKTQYANLKGDKEVRNSFLRSLNHLVKYKQYILNSSDNNCYKYPLYGNNFIEENEISEDFDRESEINCYDEANINPNYIYKTTVNKLPFNNQSNKNLVANKFRIHTNNSNFSINENYSTSNQLIKSNYLNDQFNIGVKKEEFSGYLKLLSTNEGLYKKIIKKFEM